MSRSLTKRLLGAMMALAGALILAASPVLAGSVTLNWDPVPDPDRAGYRIYYGTTSGTYPTNVDAGNVTSYTINNLTDCTIYFFAVKAYDTAGNLSTAFSNELSGMAKPTVASASPTSASQNSANLNLTLTGTNFRTGATVTFSGTGITVNSVSVGSCTSLTANVTIALTAATGARDITVRNTDQSAGLGTALFTVTLADVTAPTISAVASSGITTTGATVTWTTNEASNSQVEYRVQGTTTYSSTTVNPSMVTAHSVTLSGLQEATVYEYHVISDDAAGNTATSTPNGTFTTRSFEYITLEAEGCTLTAPMASHNDFDTPLAFSGNYMWTPAGTGTNTNGNPTAKATCSVTTGNAGSYTVWVRMYAATANNDSFWQSVDGGTKTALTAGNLATWVWTKGASWTLTAGLHSLVLGHRDEQTRGDRIILTDDPNFTPTATPTDSTPAIVSAVTSSGVTTTTANISWTTNEPADTKVEYGTSTSYGSITPVNPAMTLSHNVALSSLLPATTYHYRVISVDRGGNVTQSADFTFVTATPADVTPPANVQNLRRGDTTP